MSTTQPIRSKKHVRALAGYYLKRGQIRNYVLIVLGVHTALRISDLLRLRWCDVYDFKRGRVRETFTLIEQKTRKPKVIALNQAAVASLMLLAARTSATPDGFLIENVRTKQAISRVQAYRLIRAAAAALDIGRVSCHSLRKTFGYLSLKSGVSVVVLMDIFNHSSLTVTKRYLGLTQDDKNNAYLRLKVFK
jgi:integrase